MKKWTVEADFQFITGFYNLDMVEDALAGNYGDAVCVGGSHLQFKGISYLESGKVCMVITPGDFWSGIGIDGYPLAPCYQHT